MSCVQKCYSVYFGCNKWLFELALFHSFFFIFLVIKKKLNSWNLQVDLGSLSNNWMQVCLNHILFKNNWTNTLWCHQRMFWRVPLPPSYFTVPCCKWAKWPHQDAVWNKATLFLSLQNGDFSLADLAYANLWCKLIWLYIHSIKNLFNHAHLQRCWQNENCQSWNEYKQG